MNKKTIIICIILIITISAGIIYYNNTSKIDSEIPSINTNIRRGNTEYNQAVNALNNKNYSQAQQRSINALENYGNVSEKLNTTIELAKNQNETILLEYLMITQTEIDQKINATKEILTGIELINNNNYYSSIEHFRKSNTIMSNTTQYSDKRNQIESNYPEKFIK
ncbi:MAG: hypothetical protein E7Z84_05460 [Methanosphaera stadtmanae]|nr:hypothetical protein [Methanosphaera stadtmanae]